MDNMGYSFHSGLSKPCLSSRIDSDPNHAVEMHIGRWTFEKPSIAANPSVVPLRHLRIGQPFLRNQMLRLILEKLFR